MRCHSTHFGVARTADIRIGDDGLRFGFIIGCEITVPVLRYRTTTELNMNDETGRRGRPAHTE